MTLNRLSAIKILTAAALSLVGCIQSAEAATTRLLGLTDNNTLLSFDLNDPSQTQSIGITGIDGTLLGIDFRPANGLLYAISDTSNIYTIDPISGAATLQSTLSPSTLTYNGGLESGFDFNPAVDLLRLEGSNDQNFRINVDTGAISDFDPATDGVQSDGTLAYAVGDVNEGVNPNITAVAYLNSFPGAPAGRTTAHFTIDSELNTLNQQNPANNGTLITIGELGIDFDELGGFDIFSPTEGVNTAYAASSSMLYTIDLATGQASVLGTIGEGNQTLIGLTATSVPEPGSATSLLGLGAALALLGLRNRFRNI